jgi:hypothetical protein
VRYTINDIARVITEDPDILRELDSSIDKSLEEPSTPNIPIKEPDIKKSATEPEVGEEKPLTALDVEKQAEDITGENPDQAIKDQIKAQEEAEKQQEIERQKILQPQMQELQTSMGQLGTGITQGAAAVKNGGEAFQGLDKNMSAIQALLQNLEKQIY